MPNANVVVVTVTARHRWWYPLIGRVLEPVAITLVGLGLVDPGRAVRVIADLYTRAIVVRIET